MTAKKEHPLRLKKLNNQHRYKLAVLASEKFRSPALRIAEAEAKQNLTGILYRDATEVPEKDLAVLEKYGFARTIAGFDLPPSIGYRKDGDREFKLPNGSKVVRKGGNTKLVDRPRDDEIELPTFSSWGDAAKHTPDRTGGGQWRSKAGRIELPKRVKLPCGRGDNTNDDLFEDMRTDHDTCGEITFYNLHGGFLSEEAVRAIVAYFLAAEARILEERMLICTAVKVIAGCTVYAQILDFWPEAAEIEESLFGSAPIPNAFSVVALSDEDKAALCRNMASRGVESPICNRSL